MDTRIETFLTLTDRFDTTVREAVPADRWDAASPCEEWTAADVLDHVVDSQRGFLEQRGAALGSLPDAPPEARWDAHVAELRTLVSDDAFTTEEYDGYFGRACVADTLRTFHGLDLLVHRWDLGQAVGVDVTWTEDEMDDLERSLDTLGDNLYSQGACKPAVPAPPGAPRQERLLARMGRTLAD